MIKAINLAEKEKSIEALTIFKTTQYVSYDVRINNSHIKSLNKIIGREIFKKDSVYIDSNTLWEIMQPVGVKKHHNSHNLTPESIYDILIQIKNSDYAVESYDGRYLVITISTCESHQQHAVIIEPCGSLKNDFKAKVIRIITMYRYE